MNEIVHYYPNEGHHNRINQKIKSVRMQYGKEAIHWEEFFIEGTYITEILKL